MTKYKAIPICIEAIQWGENGFKGQTRWLEAGLDAETIKINKNGTCIIHTPASTQLVNPSDYILKDIDGTLRVCTYDVFIKSYEIVEE